MGNTKKMSAKDRICQLLDANSFVEIGASVTKRNTDFNLNEKEAPSDGVITGYGTIDDKPVYVYSQDASVLGGTIGEMHAKKIVRLYDLAMKVGAPVIALCDCAGIRLQEATDALAGFGEVFFRQTQASGVIPQISAVFGTCGGGSAISAAISDFTFMTEKDSHLFVNSPNAIAGNNADKNDTSSAKFQAEAGTCDFVYANEADTLDAIRKLISILPANYEDYMTDDSCDDDLNRATPSVADSKDDPAVYLKDIADNGEFVEVKNAFAKDMVTAFVRINGMTVGAIANRCAVTDEKGKVTAKFDNALSAEGCRKASSFVKFCDAFDIPVVTFTNVNGYKNCEFNEKNIAKAAAELTCAFAGATVPKINVINGNAMGSAYLVMNSKHIGADMVFAVEDSKIGMMDSKLAAQILTDSKDSKVLEAEAQKFDELQQSVVSAAKRGYVDAVISADSVRQHVAYALDMLFAKKDSMPEKKHSSR